MSQIVKPGFKQTGPGENPFEKVKSASEAKAIYRRLPAEAEEFFCKGEEILFGFRPDSFDEKTGLAGHVLNYDKAELLSESVVVNFMVGPDRYYCVSQFTVDPTNPERGSLKFTEVLYRLERRSHYRVSIPTEMQRDCNFINQEGKSIFVASVILDVSQGGARLQALKGKIKDIKEGVRVRCVMHIRGKWKFELVGQIRHVIPGQLTDVFGLQFQGVDENTNRKLLSMMLELQREVLRAGHKN